MSALLPGYAHDIFISYRHNDNLKDGWVTKFVQHLKDELRAILKDQLSIYFDLDPKDGLGESHHVADSLDPRLKSLIFIPLISGTYCDTERYSWKHEFLPFKALAKNDALGLKLTLPGGNSISRILPLRIRDIDDDDQQLLERELEGQLRSIDFVYRRLGVNRPLQPSDDDLPPEPDQPARLLYRNQLSTVAHDIKQMVAAIKLKSAADAGRAPGGGPAAGAPTGHNERPADNGAGPAGPGGQRLTVFLPWTARHLLPLREELAQTCRKAGFDVQPITDCPHDEDEFRQRVQEALAASTCAVHLLGTDFGRCFEEESTLSFPKYAYQQAARRLKDDPTYRQCVWLRPTEGAAMKSDQQQFVAEVRNELTERRTLSTVETAMHFVENLRGLLAPPAARPAGADENTDDIFFVYNQQDGEEANVITNLLSQHLPVELLTIEPDSEDAYKSMAVASIPRSRLAVVYFKHSAEWALPFVKQVWRLVGGASSRTPILLLGEDDPIINRMRMWKAPRVISTVLAHGQIPTEVHRIYTEINR